MEFPEYYAKSQKPLPLPLGGGWGEGVRHWQGNSNHPANSSTPSLPLPRRGRGPFGRCGK